MVVQELVPRFQNSYLLPQKHRSIVFVFFCGILKAAQQCCSYYNYSNSNIAVYNAFLLIHNCDNDALEQNGSKHQGNQHITIPVFWVNG